MTLNEYQDFVDDIRLPSASHGYARLGLVGEVGELLSVYAKAVRDGPRADYDANIKKELGDIMWFVSALASDHGLTLAEIIEANVEKLSSRRDRGTLQGSGDNR